MKFAIIENLKPVIDISYDAIQFDSPLKTDYDGLQNRQCYGNSLFFQRGYVHKNQTIFKPRPQVKLAVGICMNKYIARHVSEGLTVIRHKETKFTAILNNYIFLHAWNVVKKNGRIFDVTLGKRSPDYYYLGWIVPQQAYNKMDNAPCVKTHLINKLGIDRKNDIVGEIEGLKQ